MSQAGGFIPTSTIISTITGNSGGAVSPLSGNINVVGDGVSILIAGNPATHTLTASVVPNRYVQTITSDTGATFPTGGNINIVGGTNITTATAGSTITINSSGLSYLTYTNVNSSPYNVLNTQNYISVDCSGGPITIRLPDTNPNIQSWIIKDRTGNAAANNITVTTVSGIVNIDGNPNFIMNTDYETINVLWNNTTYEIY